MPWYKSGTVSVVLNSNAVIGTGTAFLSHSRVGDAFRGPDGGWYEVTNIASDTAMSISPVYKGATNAAGAYALAPMQGYVKDSADALRSLVNTYGAKLAALGATANYDILPVTKGGTGAANQADARVALGLGTAAVVEIQTSVIDSTAGRAMVNGAWGWGSVSADNPTDLNAISVSQKFGVNTGASNIPWAFGSTTVPFAAGSCGIAMTWTANHQSQIIVNRTASMVALRRKNAGVWAPDDYFCLYPTGQTFLSVAQGGTGGSTQAAARTGLGLGAAAVAAIVGTVSQSGGVPTGAIIENVVNANGRAIKFADGTMICISPQLLCPGPTAAFGSLFISPSPIAWTYPAAFVGSVPALTASTANTVQLIVTTLTANATNGSFAFYHPFSTAGSLTVYALAVGRWF